MTPQELEDWQKQQKRTNAGMEAMKETANSVGNLLPTSRVGELIPQIVISEGVERIVDANTTAPTQPPAQGTKEPDTKAPSAESGNVGDTVPRTQPKPPQQDKSGLKLNPDYRGNFGDYGPTEKPRFWPERSNTEAINSKRSKEESFYKNNVVTRQEPSARADSIENSWSGIKVRKRLRASVVKVGL